MKNIALLCLLCLPASAQTYSSFTLTNFSTVDLGGDIEAETFFDVPANTLFEAISIRSTYGCSVDVQYPASTNWLYMGEADSSGSYEAGRMQVLGPAKMRFSGNGDNTRQDISVLLASFTPVNTTPALTGYGVQPNGKSATVTLETSTNLITWQATTNGTYAATNSAAFYRLNMSVN